MSEKWVCSIFYWKILLVKTYLQWVTVKKDFFEVNICQLSQLNYLFQKKRNKLQNYLFTFCESIFFLFWFDSRFSVNETLVIFTFYIKKMVNCLKELLENNCVRTEPFLHKDITEWNEGWLTWINYVFFYFFINGLIKWFRTFTSLIPNWTISR